MLSGTVNTWARLAGAGLLATYVGLTVLLSFLRPDLSIRSDQISRFLVGPYSGLAMASFCCLAAGTGILAVRRYRRSSRPVAVILLGYAVACLVVGATQPGEAPHDLAALTAFCAIPAAVVLDPTLRREEKRLWLGAVAASLAAWPVGLGLGERATVLVEVFWLVRASCAPEAAVRL